MITQKKNTGESGGRSAGYTMVELTIALLLFTVIMSAFAMATMRASSIYEQESVQIDLETRAHRVLDQIASELIEATRDDLNPALGAPFSSPVINYRACQGFAGGVVQLGPSTRIGFQLEQGEVDDGLDNNRNGLIDEGTVTWSENPGAANERRTARCHWVREFLEGEVFNGLDDNGNGLVDERGLCFDVQGDVVRIQLTLERMDDDRRLVTRTVETAIKVQN